MSRLYFHTETEGDAELLGAERHHMAAVVSDVALAFMPHLNDPRLAAVVLPEVWATYGTIRNERLWRAAINHGPASFFHRDGQPLGTFELLLNTVLSIGNDALCLFARLHAQSEIHCYVEGPDRAWMADLVDEGLKSGIYRQGVGWDKVRELLASGDAHPVVCSHSSSESFPNRYAAQWEPPQNDEGDPDEDAWYELPNDEQWRLGLAGLRDEPGRGLQLAPERLRYRYGHEVDLIQLFAKEF